MTQTVATVLLAGMSLATLLGCSADEVVKIPPPSHNQFWAVRMNAKAVTVAIDGTQQLVANVFDETGAPITGLPKPKFSVYDKSKATVDENGLVTGKAITGSLNVIASLTVNGLTRADTTIVVVTAQRRALKSLKITGPGGGALPSLVSYQTYASIQTQVRDSADNLVPGLSMSVRALDPRVLNVFPTSVGGASLGKSKVVATTTSYGQTLSDTVEFGVGYKMSESIYMSQGAYSPAAVSIAVGGSVLFGNNDATQPYATVTFDSLQPTGGNIDSLAYRGPVTRVFPTAGVYTFKNKVTKATGTVYVRPQPQY